MSLTRFVKREYSATYMEAELGSRLRVVGLVRSPDREGALAHLDADRGFALVARGPTSLADVIDPAVWVREKLCLALGSSPESGDSPLRRILAALRALHGEMMRRPEGGRPWVSVLAALFHGGNGILISAGDCPCFRYRDGLLSRLKRSDEETLPAGVPPGALGSEPQVRIEVVPLSPRPGDIYVTSTRQLREGELAALARDLGAARTGAELLRAAVEGSGDRGRLVIRVLESDEDATLPERADALPLPPLSESSLDVDETESVFEIQPLFEPGAAVEERGDGASTPAAASVFEPPAAAPPFEPPIGVPRGIAGLDPRVPEEPAPESAEREGEAAEAAETAPDARPRALAPVDDGAPWWEALALWGGGALAIIALFLLLRAILPALIENDGERPGREPVTAVATGHVDFLSDPPGASVRVDGEYLEGKTPLHGVALAAGAHRVELDWGPSGSWRDTIEVVSGARLVVHPAIFGTVSFRSSDPSRSLDVYVDGTYVGATPLTLDRIVVGRHLVRFGGPGSGPTTQEIDVLRGAPTEIVANAGPAPEMGRVTVRSALLTDAGFEAGRKDPVWIDGAMRGVTPLSLSLSPGAHSVRVARRGFPAQVSVVDVKAGGEHFVMAEFGARSEPPLVLSPPAAISIAGQLPITITLPIEERDPSMSVWLYAAAPEGSFQAKRMTRLDAMDGVYATLVPTEVLRNAARRVRLYVKASGRSGRELHSEIVTVPVRD